MTNLQKKIKPVQGYTDRLGIEVAGFVMMGAWFVTKYEGVVCVCVCVWFFVFGRIKGKKKKKLGM